MKNVLIAFDKFKDALSAAEACRIAAEALAEAQPGWSAARAPLADGGDGFCQTLVELSSGRLEQTTVTGPRGNETRAAYGIVDTANIHPPARQLLALPETARRLAIVELAQSSGIALLSPAERNPWKCTSYGLGQLLAEARSQGAEAALVGLGGSATHDLALGALQALGYQFGDPQGRRLDAHPTPEIWESIASILPPQTGFALPLRLACDVQNPLLGPNGAAAIFGPQKGLDPHALEALEKQTERIAILLCYTRQAPTAKLEEAGAGAAGGAAFGLGVGLGGTIVPGAELVFAWTGLHEKLAVADIVITGEGRFDASSLLGKGPGSLARHALAVGKDVRVFAGALGELPDPSLERRCVAISSPELPLGEAIAATGANLRNAILSAFASR